MDEQQQKPAKTEKSYGGRSKKQWFIIYLVVAIVVYAIIYFLWIKPDGSSGGSSLY